MLSKADNSKGSIVPAPLSDLLLELRRPTGSMQGNDRKAAAERGRKLAGHRRQGNRGQ